MAHITYKGKAIDHIAIIGLYEISNLDIGKIQKCTVELPAYDEYRLLFADNYSEIVINEKGRNYHFSIFGTPSIDGKIIKIDLISTIEKTLTSKIDMIIRKEEYNPVTAVMEILNDINIDYDRYSFLRAEQLRLNNDVKMEIVFIPSLMDMTYKDFLQEILNRVGCVMVYDVVNNQVICIDYFTDRKDIVFQDIFNQSIIDTTSIKISRANDFYNRFTIGIFPTLTARDMHEYEYQVTLLDSLNIQQTVFLHESLLSDVTIIDGTPTILKYDWFVDNAFFTSGARGVLSGVRRLFSVGLENETIQKKQKSLAENEGVEKIWNDTKNNNNAGVLKHTSVTGAYWVGNKVIQTMYDTRMIIDFEYPEDSHVRIGDFVIYNKIRCIVKDKNLTKDFLRYNYTLEEVLL